MEEKAEGKQATRKRPFQGRVLEDPFESMESEELAAPSRRFFSFSAILKSLLSGQIGAQRLHGV